MTVGWDAALARDGRNVRPIGVLGTWAIVLVAGAVVMMFVSAIADWVVLADFEKSWGQPGGTRTEWESYTWAGITSLLLQLGAGIVIIAWLWRARRNAEAMCAARHRLAIGWVIGGWFCPVVNLWFPHTIMSDVWRAGDPRTPSNAPDLRGRPGSGLVTAWWLSLLAGWVLGFVAVILGLPSARVERTGGYVIYGYAPVGGFGLIAVELIRAGVLAASAFCLGAVIIQVQRRQQAWATPQSTHPRIGAAPRPHMSAPGQSLHDVVTKYGPLGPRAVENVAIGIAHALSAIHSAGRAHGAVTPESVIVTETGASLIGFDHPAPVPGIPAFAAPEQIAGEQGEPASDIFSLGGVLAYALTGRPPFGDADTATLRHRMAIRPPDLAGIPETRIRFVITGCLTGSPAARLTTAQLLGQLEATAAPAPPPSPTDRTAPADLDIGDRVLTIAIIATATILIIIAIVIAAVEIAGA